MAENGTHPGETPILLSIREHHIAGLIILLVGLFGMTCNYLVVGLIRRVSSLQNAFGRLTMNQALGESIHLTVFAFYFAPTVLLNIQFLKEERVSRIFGHINLICYDICTYSHLVISVNRFTAIFLPFKYNDLFNEKTVKVIIPVIWFLAITPTFYFYIYEDCRFIYTDAFWNFTFTTSPSCLFITWYADFLKYVSIIFFIATIDLITFVKVRFMSRKVTQACRDTQTRKKRADEINFVKQVCLQGVVFMCELITYFVLVNFFDNKWIKFFLTTFAWEMVHSLDGLITLSFNKGFGRLIRGFMSSSMSHLVSEHSHDYHNEPSKAPTTTMKRTTSTGDFAAESHHKE